MKKLIYICLLLMLFFSCQEDDTAGHEDTEPIAFQNALSVVTTYGGSEEDDALSVAETLDGNIVVLGYTQSTDGNVAGKTATDSDYWLLKLDQDLNVLWQKTFGGSGDDRGQSVVATNDGGFLVSGYARSSDGDVSTNFGFHDYWVLKLDAGGDVLWEKSFGFSGNDRSFSAIQTQDGGFFITGFLDVTSSGGQGNDNGHQGRPNSFTTLHGVGEFWGIKLNSAGDIQWRRYFGGTNNDRSYDVIQADDGSIIMVGSSESDDFDITSPMGSYDFWAVKVNLEGDLIWQKNFGGQGIDIGYAIDQTFDQDFIFAGDTRSDDGDVEGFRGNTDYWLVKFDQSAQLLWQKTYGGSDFDSARAVDQLISGELLITGSSKSENMQLDSNFGLNDVWVVLTDDNGNFKSGLSVGGSGLDFANDAVQLSNGEVIVVGSSESNDNLINENKGDKDILIIKLK